MLPSIRKQPSARILHSGSKPQDKGDSKSGSLCLCGLPGPSKQECRPQGAIATHCRRNPRKHFCLRQCKYVHSSYRDGAASHCTIDHRAVLGARGNACTSDFHLNGGGWREFTKEPCAKSSGPCVEALNKTPLMQPSHLRDIKITSSYHVGLLRER